MNQRQLEEEFELLDDSVEYTEEFNPEPGVPIVHAKEQFRHQRSKRQQQIVEEAKRQAALNLNNQNQPNSMQGGSNRNDGGINIGCAARGSGAAAGGGNQNLLLNPACLAALQQKQLTIANSVNRHMRINPSRLIKTKKVRYIFPPDDKGLSPEEVEKWRNSQPVASRNHNGEERSENENEELKEGEESKRQSASNRKRLENSGKQESVCILKRLQPHKFQQDKISNGKKSPFDEPIRSARVAGEQRISAKQDEFSVKNDSGDLLPKNRESLPNPQNQPLDNAQPLLNNEGKDQENSNREQELKQPEKAESVVAVQSPPIEESSRDNQAKDSSQKVQRTPIFQEEKPVSQKSSQNVKSPQKPQKSDITFSKLASSKNDSNQQVDKPDNKKLEQTLKVSFGTSQKDKGENESSSQSGKSDDDDEEQAVEWSLPEAKLNSDMLNQQNQMFQPVARSGEHDSKEQDGSPVNINGWGFSNQNQALLSQKFACQDLRHSEEQTPDNNNAASSDSYQSQPNNNGGALGGQNQKNSVDFKESGKQNSSDKAAADPDNKSLLNVPAKRANKAPLKRLLTINEVEAGEGGSQQNSYKTDKDSLCASLNLKSSSQKEDEKEMEAASSPPPQEHPKKDEESVVMAAMQVFQNANAAENPEPAAAAQQQKSVQEKVVSEVPAINADELSWHEQLGGDEILRQLVDNWMGAVLKDSELAAGHQSVVQGENSEEKVFIHNEKLFQFMKHLLDGQRFYIGRDLYEVHKNLGVQSSHFDKMSNILKTELLKIKPRPKMPVFRAIMNRVSTLRDKIVIPQQEEEESKDVLEHAQSNNNDGESSLFVSLGQETGVRKIIQKMFEIAKEEGIEIIKLSDGEEQVPDQLLFQEQTQISLSICSFLDKKYAWYRDTTTTTANKPNYQKFPDKDFQKIIVCFEKACKVFNLKQQVIEAFLNLLETHKYEIFASMLDPQSASGNGGVEPNERRSGEAVNENNHLEQSSGSDSIDELAAFKESFIQLLFEKEHLKEAFESQDAQDELIIRITKILHSERQEDLNLDIDKLSDEEEEEVTEQNLIEASDVFCEALQEIGVDEESAEAARTAFIALQINAKDIQQYKLNQKEKVDVVQKSSRKSQSNNRKQSSKVVLNQFLKSENNERSHNISHRERKESIKRLLSNSLFNQIHRLSSQKVSSEKYSLEDESLKNDEKDNKKNQISKAVDFLQTNKKYQMARLIPILDQIGTGSQKGLSNNLQQKVAFQSNISKFIGDTENLARRYLVLTKVSLAMYKDELAFQQFPNKPQLLVPLAEIKTLKINLMPSIQVIKNKNLSEEGEIISEKEKNLILEVALHLPYEDMISQIAQMPQIKRSKNDSCSESDLEDEGDFSKQKQKNDSNLFVKNKICGKNSLVFVDLDEQLIQTWKERIDEFRPQQILLSLQNQEQVAGLQNSVKEASKNMKNQKSSVEKASVSEVDLEQKQAAAVVAVENVNSNPSIPDFAALEDSQKRLS